MHNIITHIMNEKSLYFPVGGDVSDTVVFILPPCKHCRQPVRLHIVVLKARLQLKRYIVPEVDVAQILELYISSTWLQPFHIYCPWNGVINFIFPWKQHEKTLLFLNVNIVNKWTSSAYWSTETEKMRAKGRKWFFFRDSFVKLEPELMCVFGWSREH